MAAVTLDKASEQTGLSVRALRRLARLQLVPAKKVGRRWLVDTDALKQLFPDERWS
jgi:DNA-binding transcriptional MerR regulator